MTTHRSDHLTVERRMVVIKNTGPWEASDFDRLVWSHSGIKGDTAILAGPMPATDVYTRGILTAKTDGCRVDLAQFDQALEALGTNRDEVQRSIVDAEGFQ